MSSVPKGSHFHDFLFLLELNMVYPRDPRSLFGDHDGPKMSKKQSVCSQAFFWRDKVISVMPWNFILGFPNKNYATNVRRLCTFCIRARTTKILCLFSYLYVT